jgi:N-acetylglucosamine-6-phosphate deacetylase
MMQLFVDGRVILENEIATDQCVLCRDGLISYVGSRPKRLPKDVEILSLKGRYLSPGFVDIHVHGGAGADFMDGTPEAISVACQAHLRHGVTTIYPTCTTGQPDQIMAMIHAVKSVKKAPQDAVLPRIEGVHLYGPYFAPEKAGCHSKKGCRPPTHDEMHAFFKTGLIRIATCAAELEGATDFYKLAKRHKCLITCGHSNSSWQEMEKAFQHGMRHVDHFWCAMSSVPSLRSRFGTPMQASMTEFVLANPEMSTEVIADGFHLSGELLQFAWQMKGSKRLCLVSDCNRALDMPPGTYAFGDVTDENWITHDGDVGRGNDGALASSVVALDTMIRQMRCLTKVPLHEIIRMASLTPAERTGIAAQVGSIAVGKVADLVVLSPRWNVEAVYLGGQNVLASRPKSGRVSATL